VEANWRDNNRDNLLALLPEKADWDLMDLKLHFGLALFTSASKLESCKFVLVKDLLNYLRSLVYIASKFMKDKEGKEPKWGEYYKSLCVGFVKKVRVEFL